MSARLTSLGGNGDNDAAIIILLDVLYILFFAGVAWAAGTSCCGPLFFGGCVGDNILVVALDNDDILIINSRIAMDERDEGGGLFEALEWKVWCQAERCSNTNIGRADLR